MQPSYAKTIVIIVAAVAAGQVAAQTAQHPRDGRGLYDAACSTCHGGDGRGRTRAEVGFSNTLPDFTDCDFASREADPDWTATIHEGGRARGFDRIMPAFGELLSDEEIALVLGYIRTFCRNPDWPRGDLNFPLALFTEKAYPEDEAVIEGTIDTAGDDSYSAKFIWEQRFGTRNQMELILPVTRADLGPGEGWKTGTGDLAIGVKHVLRHSYENGSILSIGGEFGLATGDERRGFGAGTNKFETYVSYGKAIGDSSFLQLQGIAEFPLRPEFDDEVAVRAAFGHTLITGGIAGRAWTPMLEVLGAREQVSGADTEWDVVPQLQITLSQRQHVIASVGIRQPVTQRDSRDSELVFYLLWDWFDGGVLEGW